jgi:hypothetical protein
MKSKGMNRRKKRIALRHGLQGVWLTVVLLGLVSCEKDALNGSDGKVTVHFTLGDLSYGADEVRSARMDPETVVVPVEGDLHLYATLEEEEETAPLRAPGSTALEVGTRLRIVAYDGSDNYVTDVEYRVTNTITGGIEPVSATTGLTLTAGNYRFVAYSLNTTTVPAYATPAISETYSPNTPDDPLWGSSSTVSIVEDVNNISIAMKHRFSRVAIRATTTGFSASPPAITAIGAALMGYKATDWEVLTGAFAKGAGEDQPFTGFSPLNATTVTCAQKMVYAGGESTTSIRITTATVGGTTRTGLVARFNTQLAPGKSYLLRLSFKKMTWAWSNIYWDATTDPSNPKLTFDTENKGNQGYQGVFFRFGSLVGLSPSPISNFSGSIRIYMPVVKSPLADSWWKPTTGSAMANDPDFPDVGSNYTNWAHVPYMNNTYVHTDYSRNNTFVIDAERNTQEMYENFLGDICQYLSKTGAVSGNYRLPVSTEFAAAASNWDSSNPATTPVAGGWVRGAGGYSPDGIDTGNTEGKANLINMGYVHAINSTLGVTVPASGRRYVAGGRVDYAANNGRYWSGSASDKNSGWDLSFNIGGINPDASDSRDFGFAVRCVTN